MLYEYLALQKDSTKVKGVIESNSEKDLTEYLKKNGLFPIEIKVKTSSKLGESIATAVDAVSFKDTVLITRQLSFMLDAGLTLISAIEILKKQTNKASLKKMLSEIDQSLRNGKTFSYTIENFPKYFTRFYIALVKSGEASGKLNYVLNSLALHLEQEKSFKQTVRNALIYPVAIISAMVIMMFVMFTFVMPQLLSLFDSFEVELPATTIFIKNLSTFMNQNFLFIIIGVIIVFLGFLRYKKSNSGSKVIDKILFNLPIFGNIIKISGLVDVTRTLAILISSGVPILDGLHIVIDVNSNVVFRNAFTNVRDKVEKGMSIGNAMLNESIFPESLIQMTIVGEQTGSLDKTLHKVSEYYQSESELAIKGLLNMMEPTILIVLGVVVGFLVVSIITPIFSLTSSLQ